jgi:hypothetical protein
VSDSCVASAQKIPKAAPSQAGWSWGCVSAIDREGRAIWIADAHRGDGKRFVVHAEEKLTAFLELESAIRAAQCRLAFRTTFYLDVSVRSVLRTTPVNGQK